MMQKIIFLILLSICSELLAKAVVAEKIKQVYIVNYVKNTGIKKQVKKYWTSVNDRFIGVNVVYKEFKNDSFYDDFKEKGFSFLNDFMLKNDKDVVFILYQKRKKRKITLIAQKKKVNAYRSISISSKKFSQDVVYEKIISKSLKMLGELLIIQPSKRLL